MELSFASIYNTDIFSDFQITCSDGGILKLHKVILNQIPYFNTYFHSQVEADKSKISTPYSKNVVDFFIRRYYKVESKPLVSDLIELYQLSELWLDTTNKVHYRDLIYKNLAVLSQVPENLESLWIIFSKENMLECASKDSNISIREKLFESLSWDLHKFDESILSTEIFGSAPDEIKYKGYFLNEKWDKLLGLDTKRVKQQVVLDSSKFTMKQKSLIIGSFTNSSIKINSYDPFQAVKISVVGDLRSTVVLTRSTVLSRTPNDGTRKYTLNLTRKVKLPENLRYERENRFHKLVDQFTDTKLEAKLYPYIHYFCKSTILDGRNYTIYLRKEYN